VYIEGGTLSGPAGTRHMQALKEVKKLMMMQALRTLRASLK
jgi:hypothetical protein